MRINAPIDLWTRVESLGLVQIRTAKRDDVAFVDHLQRTWSNHVGFIPRTGLLDRIRRGNCWIIRAPGQEAGYLMYAGVHRGPAVRLSQIAIDDDLIRRGIGTLAIQTLRLQCPEKPLLADVRDGLPMCDVARSMGAWHIATDTTPTARGRDLLRFTWPQLRPPLFQEAR